MKTTYFVFLTLSLFLIRGAGAANLESILQEGLQAKKGAPASLEIAKSSALSEAMQLALQKSMPKSIDVPNSEQNIFLRSLEAADWEKATLQFQNAFEGTPFQTSANGRALLGYVQFQAGLAVTGVQTLFMAENPREINSQLREEWRRLIPADHFVWGLAQVQWQNGWEIIFGETVPLRLKIVEVLAATKEPQQLQSLSAQAPVNSKEKAQLDWQLLIAYSLQDQTDRAAKILATLMKAPSPPVSRDLMQMTAARLLFQGGYFDTAIKYYEKVSKASEYWTEAQEEMAWAYIRKGETHNALAVSQSLVNSGLNFQVSPEAFFVRALSFLKVCDYSGVTETLRDFPRRFKARTKALESLSREAANQEVDKGLALLKTGKIGIKDLGKSAQTLPRRFAQDENLYQFLQSQKNLEAEAQVAEKLYAKSLSLTGLQGSFDKLRQKTLQRSQMAKTAAYSRVKELAEQEVAETKGILHKLHIVEAEVIQQVSLVDKIAKNAKNSEEKKGTTGYKGTARALKFPAEDEIWFDELSNYRVDIKKACTVKK